ncbi:hypothetical protein Runsl_1263 [Runella slithyformis DSM 19594]|uniref:Uncharacterized protein n=1 Tax=Runella slithyformis (strain ATCC 29530 / DSM 19594 / LMG 11500 / NCIMB 11436 / LSU 4) TaxID=761193 RepID=A0A7U3ZI86_RUNSL|nr:hypothetical protein Runsl_1263 [Runella slithyformis DSM 19594]
MVIYCVLYQPGDEKVKQALNSKGGVKLIYGLYKTALSTLAGNGPTVLIFRAAIVAPA